MFAPNPDEFVGFLITIFNVFGILGYLFIIIIIRALGAQTMVGIRKKNYISVIIPLLLISGYIALAPDSFLTLELFRPLFIPMIFISGIALLVMNKLLKETRL